MHIDILFFAAIAVFLIYRLNAALGTRNGNERQRPNPFTNADPARPAVVTPLPTAAPAPFVIPAGSRDQLVDAANNVDGRIDHGLGEIAAADAYFDLNTFLQGARYAFEMVVTAYARGDLDALKPLLTPKLYGDFSAGVRTRIANGHTTELTIQRIKAARITEAHMGGTIAYITVDFDVDEVSVTRDASGKVVDGNADNISTIRDIWTFMRDTRTSDPNWILIETQALEQ
ncbi:MAG: Tim44/TimA family putative adaptor protein [Micavibrio sp.]|nr:Tim44/TimA family putative adaptor protein [Micavibrio sp.]